jgi:hypothetical protein
MQDIMQKPLPAAPNMPAQAAGSQSSPGCKRTRTMRIADKQVKRGILANVLCFLLLASTNLFAQKDARGLVSKMVNNELEALKHPRYWIYLDSKARPERVELARVIQMPECWLASPILINGRPPTEEETKRARERLEHLVNDAHARIKNREEIDADTKKSAEFLRLLPDAFLFNRDGSEGRSVRLRFRPNPKYRPSSNEAKVFHSMEGVMLIDAKQTRLAKLTGKLISDVEFGFGILGKLQKGGTFEVVQSEVARKEWEMSLLDVHISGRALFFHTIGEQQHEVRSQFTPVPSGLSLAQAASMVVDGGNHRSPAPK